MFDECYSHACFTQLLIDSNNLIVSSEFFFFASSIFHRSIDWYFWKKKKRLMFNREFDELRLSLKSVSNVNNLLCELLCVFFIRTGLVKLESEFNIDFRFEEAKAKFLTSWSCLSASLRLEFHFFLLNS